MKELKKSTLFLLFMMYTMQISPACLGVDPQKNVLQKTYQKLKAFGRVAGGIGLALIAHMATEYLGVHAHEYGHACANKLTGGDGGKVTVDFRLDLPEVAFLPFRGLTSFERLGNQAIVSMSGPLGGIACNYALVTGLAYVRSKLANRPVEPTSSLFKKPFTIYREVSSEITRAIEHKSTRSLLETFFTAFFLLKSGRMLGEAIYGFTPFSVDGDGKKLWEAGGVKSDVSLPTSDLIWFATSPASMAIVLGVTEGIRKSFNHQPAQSSP